MKTFSETVRDAADIVRVVSDYIALKGAGNAFKALCPFHSEKTPSFSVHREKQLFHCFGCQAGGDVFEFVKLYEKVSFPEAIRIVAEKFGVPVPENSTGSDPKAEEKKQLLEIYERTSAYYQKALSGDEAAVARQVLEKRQINAVYSQRFHLGYAPAGGLAGHLSGYLAARDPVGTGLFQKSERGEVFDRFRRRLMFPIWNERGKPIAFGGRALGDVQPKYLNSPESPLYSKSYVLYALHLAREAVRKTDRIVVVEGYFDCLSLHQGGIENVVASCGTSLTPQQVGLMNRYAREVVMNYDPDAAGQSAIRRSIDLLLDSGLRVRILRLPGALDPDAYIRAEGAETYRRLLDRAPYFWQYLMTDAAKRFDLDKPEGKAEAVGEVMAHVGRIQDRVEQLEVAKAIAEGFKLPESLLLDRLNLKARRPDLPPVKRTDAPRQVRRLMDAEKQLIQALGQDDGVGRVLQGYLSGEFWKEAWSWPVLEQLIRNPRSLDTALSGLEDAELAGAVRGAIFEQVGPLTVDHALASVQKLYDAHFVKREREIREQLKHFGAEGAPVELLRKRQELIVERNRMVEALKNAG